MKVYLVNSSPREKSCTYTALCEVEKGLKEYGVETEFFWLGNKPLTDCIDCGTCFQTRAGCVFQDPVNEFAALAKDADGFVFGSPVYYASCSGALCSFLDRLFFSNGAVLSGKPAAAVVSCRRSGGSAGIDGNIRFHDLRHTYATLAIQNGVDVKTVSSILGHYSAGFTLDLPWTPTPMTPGPCKKRPRTRWAALSLKQCKRNKIRGSANALPQNSPV